MFWNGIFFLFRRYFAICHPLKVYLQSGKRRTAFIIGVIWGICMIPSILWSKFSKVFCIFIISKDLLFFYNILSTYLTLILIFQVLYLIYSEAGYTQIVSSQDFETIYRKHDFVKIEESAMCLVRFLAISIYNKCSNFILSIKNTVFALLIFSLRSLPVQSVHLW